MSEWWNTLSGANQAFWVIALVFSFLFIILFVLSLVGLDFEGDADYRTESDSHSSGSRDSGFTFFSVRSIIAFFTVFGWVGLLALTIVDKTMTAIWVAGIAGFAAMCLVGYLKLWFTKPTHKRPIDLKNAIYQTGKVYLPIPANGRGQGKVRIRIRGSLKEIDAITEGKNLPPGSTIRVIEVINDEVFVVEKVEGLLPHELSHPRN